MHFYFAYGSNLHPQRLRERIAYAEVLGVVEQRGLRLSFAKVGHDNSGKCSFHESGDPEDSVFGVLYQIDSTGKTLLDEIEGIGKGYDEKAIVCKLNHRNIEAYTYQANPEHIDCKLPPFNWYKDLVLSGARYHSLPAAYIDNIASVHSVPDTDQQRAQENKMRLDAMLKFDGL